MNTTGNSAVAEPLEDASPKDRPADNKPRQLPPHAVIVLNDDIHSFDYVIDVFAKVFAYPVEKCRALVLQIHQQGRGIVWSGSKEVAELKRDQIRSAGPDWAASGKIDVPLGVTIESLPG